MTSGAPAASRRHMLSVLHQREREREREREESPWEEERRESERKRKRGEKKEEKGVWKWGEKRECERIKYLFFLYNPMNSKLYKYKLTIHGC